MRKKLLQIGFILNLVLLLTFFGNEENAVWNHEEADIVSFAVEDACWELTDDRELVFTFKNEYIQLDNLLLKFTETAGHDSGVLKVAITRFGKEYYHYELPLEKYDGELLYLSIDEDELENLRWNTDYRLEISVENLSGDSIYLSGCEDAPVIFKSLEGCHPIIGVCGLRQMWNTDVLKSCIMYLIYLNLMLVMVWIIIRLAGRAVYWHMGGFLLGVSLLLGLSVFFEAYELTQSNVTKYWSANFVKQLTNIPLKYGVVEQYFTAQQDVLDEIYLFFDNQTSQDEGIVHVDLLDSDEEWIAGWEAPVSKLGDDTFCLILSPEQRVKKNQEYKIQMSLEGGDSEITVRVVDNMNFHKSVGALSVGGTVRDNSALYFVQGCQVRYSFAAIALWTFLFAFLCYVMVNRYPASGKYLRWLLFFLIPTAAFWGIELLSGNLGLTGETDIVNNIVLIGAILLLLRSLLGRFADYLVTILAFVAGTVNYYVMHTRGTEFLFTDIRSAGTAMTVVGNYELTVTAPVYLAGIVTIFVMFVMGYTDRRSHIKIRLAERLITAGVGGAAMMWLLVFVLPADNISLWNISESLQEKGWLYGNFCLIKAGSISAPEGYSGQEIEAILEKYDVSADSDMETKEEVIPTNLIVIMNEALSDLQILGDLETSSDSLSFIHSLTDNTIKGNLHVPTLGGNTCNTEYEFLTGNSMHFISSSTVPYMALCEKKEPGITSMLRSQGYYTVAIHPYIGGNWNRDTVYEAMGFEEYLDIEDFEDAEYLRKFVSDKGDYDRIIEYYENFDQDEKLFIFNVTMQNHGGYDVNTGYVDKTVTIDNVECELAENYLSLIKESDEAFAYLLDYFSKVDEPTMIVMFGDHQPSFPDDFYEQLNEASDERFLYVTPYLIWTNYESDFEELADMSANYLSSYVMQCAGLELSEYQEFLLQFMQAYPVIGKYGIYNADGEYMEYSEEMEEWLKDYECLQYLRIKDRKSGYYSIFSQ